jgi:hypothetical protein
MEETKYYRTVVTVEVLTSGKKMPSFWGLNHIAQEISDGDASGSWDYEIYEVSKEEMIQLLENQGSDPSFLIPDEG